MYATESCESLLTNTTGSFYFESHKGNSISLPHWPSSKYQIFILGEGSFGKVYRIIERSTGSSFIYKKYSNILAKIQDLRTLNMLRRVNTESLNIRTIRVLGHIGSMGVKFEDVQGQTVSDVIINQLVPDQILMKIYRDTEVFAERATNYFKKNGFKDAHVYLAQIPPGPQRLKAFSVFFANGIITSRAHLHQLNIVVDYRTHELIIIDPN